MTKLKQKLEKLFWLLLIASPALDLINGLWAYLLCGGRGGMLSSLNVVGLPAISPSLAVRFAMLALMTLYLFVTKQKRPIFMFVAIGITWVMTVAWEFMRGAEFSFMADMQYIVRFCYCLMVLVVYAAMLKGDGRPTREIKAEVDKVLCWSLLILGIGVLLPYLFGMGFYTYADRMGYRGSRGFFYAGNDITAIVMLLLPVVFAGWLEQKDWNKSRYGWMRAITCTFCIVSMMLIGTKTAFLALGATVAIMAGYSFVIGITKKQWDMLLRVGILLALVVAVFALLTLGTTLVQYIRSLISGDLSSLKFGTPLDTIKDSVDATKKFGELEGVETAVFSGRTGKLAEALRQFKDAMPFSALVGIGRGTQEKIIEMDLCEVFFYYGVLGCITMLWLYVLQGVRVVTDLFRNFSLQNLAATLALALCVGFLTIAGHTLFSVTGGFYFAFMIVYARLFCSKDGMEAKII